MKFTELQKILYNSFDIEKLADIARELDVTPQVVNNWKTNNNVPQKNVKILRKKLDDIRKKKVSQKLYLTGEAATEYDSKDVQIDIIEI